MILISAVFILNGLGIIDQTIPAKEMVERGVPPAIVPAAMLAGRLVEVLAGLGLAIGIFPGWCALALFAFLVPATFIAHSFWLAAGTLQFQGQLINFSKNLAIWGGLIFIAGTPSRRNVLPRWGVVRFETPKDLDGVIDPGSTSDDYQDDAKSDANVPSQGGIKKRHTYETSTDA
jgi:putative oxidoreductase